jgi:hypothetical protein
MKVVNITLTLQLADSQPVRDWLISLIESKLAEGEAVVLYNDDEPLDEPSDFR